MPLMMQEGGREQKWLLENIESAASLQQLQETRIIMSKLVTGEGPGRNGTFGSDVKLILNRCARGT